MVKSRNNYHVFVVSTCVCVIAMALTGHRKIHIGEIFYQSLILISFFLLKLNMRHHIKWQWYFIIELVGGFLLMILMKMVLDFVIIINLITDAYFEVSPLVLKRLISKMKKLFLNFTFLGLNIPGFYFQAHNLTSLIYLIYIHFNNPR